jgi:hypothetical protein
LLKLCDKGHGCEGLTVTAAQVQERPWRPAECCLKHSFRFTALLLVLCPHIYVKMVAFGTEV